MEEFTGQWAILPAKVRYDKQLSPNAKLLYAEIAAKVNTEGYCYAHNATLARAMDLSEGQITRLVKLLSLTGYIRVDLDNERVNRDRRRIYLTSKPYIFEEEDSPCKNVEATDSPCKNVETAPAKMRGPIENSITENNKPPVSPPPGDSLPEGEPEEKPSAPTSEKISPRRKSEAKWKPERFNALWAYYPPVNGERPAKAKAVRAWDKLKPSDELIAQMGHALARQKRSRMWSEGIGIPYLSTWLNQRMWETEVAPVMEQQPHGDSGGYWAEDPEAY